MDSSATTQRDFPPHASIVAASPRDEATLELLVARPARGERTVLEAGRLEPHDGLVGDNWLARGSSSTADRSAEPDAQVTIMSTRVLAACEPDRARWPLAGDQLYADLDLSVENFPPGSRLRIGDALVEVTPLPHTGCKQFAARFGVDALAWISTPEGKAARMRGMYVKVLEGGAIRLGDSIRRA